jgi:hypothetical protein
MIKKGVLLIGLIGFGIGSCIEHEVIPPPEPVVELSCSFEGLIGGAFVEYTENVNEYVCFPSISKQSNSSTGITSAQYLFAMTSPMQATSIQIALGSLSWNDPTGTEIPSLNLFNNFFKTNDTPLYSDGAMNGFAVTYRDVNGLLWTTDQTDPGNTIEFVPGSIVQESDKNGDYSKFTALFNCTVHHTYVVPDLPLNPNPQNQTYHDSLASFLIEDAIFKGYFKR